MKGIVKMRLRNARREGKVRRLKAEGMWQGKEKGQGQGKYRHNCNCLKWKSKNRGIEAKGRVGSRIRENENSYWQTMKLVEYGLASHYIDDCLTVTFSYYPRSPLLSLFTLNLCFSNSPIFNTLSSRTFFWELSIIITERLVSENAKSKCESQRGRIEKVEKK